MHTLAAAEAINTSTPDIVGALLSSSTSDSATGSVCSSGHTIVAIDSSDTKAPVKTPEPSVSVTSLSQVLITHAETVAAGHSGE